MSYIDDLKVVFGAKLPPSHIFFATVANKVIPSYQALREAMGVTTAKENTALYKKLVAEYGSGPVVPALTFSTNLPATKTAVEGADATFAVVVTGGTSPYTYKWYWNTTLIDSSVNPTAATANLVNSNVDDTSEGAYKVVVTDAAAKTVTSVACVLTVTPAP